MRSPHVAWLYFGLALLPLTACGGGGGATASSVPPVAGPANGAMPSPGPTAGNQLPAGTSPGVIASPAPGATPFVPAPAPASAAFAVSGLGGFQGNSYAPHRSGDTYEYSEDVAVTFNKPVNAGTFSYTINPAAPSSVYDFSYGQIASITFRKTPGVVYTITIPAGVAATDGTTLAAPYVFTITTPANVQIPSPIRSTAGQPYRYGVLEHPFPFSLGDESCTGTAPNETCTLNADSQAQVQLLCNAGVRFVRIDYPAEGILTNQAGTVLLSSPDFSHEDAIMDALARCGITELPIILQYTAGSALTGGAGYPNAFQWPTATNGIPGYADFARDVVQHVMQKYPQITRVELFNEPNLSGWSDFPVNGVPGQIDSSGATTALYMRDAYAAIKSVDPAMTVVGPALADGGSDVDPRKFLQTMYSSGCRTGVCWDVLSVHNYRWYDPAFYTAPSYQNQWAIYQQLQQIAVQNGDPTPHVMLTEWGFSHANVAVGFDPQVQARYLALGFNLMLADPTVDGIVYVNLFNSTNSGPTDFWGNTALTDTSGSPLPGFNVFRTFATF